MRVSSSDFTLTGFASIPPYHIKVSCRICQTARLGISDPNPIMDSDLFPLSLPRSLHKRRNINLLSIGLPCPKAQLSLGTANPPMIDIAEETLGFRRSGLSPDLRLLIPTFSPPSAPACFTTRLRSSLKCSPTVNTIINYYITHRIGTMLSPVEFSAPLSFRQRIGGSSSKLLRTF